MYNGPEDLSFVSHQLFRPVYVHFIAKFMLIFAARSLRGAAIVSAIKLRVFVLRI